MAGDGSTMTQIGKYEVVRKTGQTPLGTIYLAFDPEMQRAVSIQSPDNASAAQRPEQRQTAQIALKRGGESLGRLNHPNIRNMLASEEADGLFYLVLEHVLALPLSERIKRGDISPAEAISLLKMTAAALDHAHSQNVFHPGLSPSCLLVDDAGLLKVAGFEMSGLPILPEEDATGGSHRFLLKSVAYRAPEFLAGEPPSARTDQFAMAAIAFELLTGRCAFDYASPLETMSALLSGALPDWTSVSTHLPSEVRPVLERALASEPEQRYSSCAQMVNALEAAYNRQTESHTRVTPVPPFMPNIPERAKTPGGGTEKPQVKPIPVRSEREKKLNWILAAACLVAVAALIFTFLQFRPIHPKEQHPSAAVPSAEKHQPGTNRADNIESVAQKAMEDTKSRLTRASQPAGPTQAEVPKPKKPAARTPKTTKRAPDLSLPEIKVDH
jgi:serine/threonine-protein kinase